MTFLRSLGGLFLLMAASASGALSQSAPGAPGDPADPHAALPRYVAKPDSAFHWTLIEHSASAEGTFLQVALVSQQWQGSSWKHRLFVFFPANTPPSSTAFLTLQMEFEARQARAGLAQVARATGIPCAILCDVPNQPLFDGREEEELINYTFEQYLQTGDPSWPLLLPMVKGTVRAMDVLQAVSRPAAVPRIERFVVAGHSKRGHTAWLTAAVDPRVSGLIAQGFNTLNATAQIPHYLATYGAPDQSALAAKRVIEDFDTPRGRSLIRMIDAYTFRERLSVPKLVIVGTNDDYTPVDALNLYWPGLPGPKSVLSLPNAGHVGASGDARLFPTAYAFIRTVADRAVMPVVESRLQQTAGKIRFTVTADGSAGKARVWVAHSSTRDFRAARWEARDLAPEKSPTGPKGTGRRQFQLELADDSTGYQAVIGEVTFERTGRTFLLSTIPYVVKGP